MERDPDRGRRRGRHLEAEGELDRDLLLIGCGELACDLLASGVVDELRFWLHPAVWGEGARPFLGQTIRMALLDSTTYDSGGHAAALRAGRAPRR